MGISWINTQDIYPEDRGSLNWIRTTELNFLIENSKKKFRNKYCQDKELSTIESYLKNKNLHKGICLYLDKNYKRISKDFELFIKDKQNFEKGRCMYWTIPPGFCCSKEEVLKSLEYRLSRLLTYKTQK